MKTAPQASTTQADLTATRVLVVVPALNEQAHIRRVIEGLLRESAAIPEFQLVVVDGGSTDGTREHVLAIAAEHAAVQLLHNPARIQSAAVNLAARRFGRQADVLIRCDAHALYPADFCVRLLESLQRTAADAVVVPMDSIGGSDFQRVVAWVSNSPIGTGGSAHRAGKRSGFVDHGHHAAFRMETFRKIGGYDETFTHNEDAEFDCRQRAAHARIYLDAETRVQYHPRASVRALWRQYFSYGAGRSRTVRRHPRSLRLRQLAVPVSLALNVAAFMVSPWFPWLLLWPALYASGLLAASLAITARERALCGLLAGPTALLMHTAWACGFYWGLFSRREPVWRVERTAPLWLVTSPEDQA